jgi:hypothetical protein
MRFVVAALLGSLLVAKAAARLESKFDFKNQDDGGHHGGVSSV